MTRPRCITGKFRYRDRIAAQLALATIDDTDPKRREKRAYRCPLCRGWHLTSQAQRTEPVHARTTPRRNP